MPPVNRAGDNGFRKDRPSGSQGTVPSRLFQGVWSLLAAYLLGSALTIGGFMLDSAIRHSPLEGGLIFALVVIFFLLAYRLLIRPRQLERARNAEQLAEINRYTHAILDSMANGLLVIDVQGSILTVNRAFLALTGYEASTWLGQTVFGLFDGADGGWLRAMQAGTLAGEDTFLLARDGTRIPVQVTASRLALHASVPEETILVIQDLRERHEAEANLLRYQNHLQEMVNERTAKLEESMVAANAASLAKNEFLANMSHEIRTPMTAIIGMTDLVLNTRLTTEQRDKLIIVQNASNNLLTLINGILDLAKIEAGQLLLERISFDLRSVVENVCDLIAVKAHEKDLELFCYIAPEIPDLVIGDPNRLTQILINLIANAIKFTEKGEVTVLVQRADWPADPVGGESRERGVGVMFSVADTGIGIPDDRQEKIFERFTQADGSITRKFGGTGLGLTISKVLAELMGGSIRVESEIDEGSIFHVMLRFGGVRRAVVDAAGVEAGDRGAAPTIGQALAGVRILIADPHLLGRTIAVEILHSFGAVVGEAEDVVALTTALDEAQVENRPWEVLMLDQRMVEIHGPALSDLTNHPGWRGKAAILLSANRRAEDLPGIGALPEMVPIIKPLKRVSLLRCLKALLEGRVCELSLEPAGWPFVDTTMPSLRILLAEDLEENRELAVEILEKAGHQVVAVKDGQEALDRMLAAPGFDLVLTDLHMPRMDGYELTRRIRERSDVSGRLPIVAVTARALPGERALCLASGMDDFLVKPYRPVELLNVTARVALKRRQKSRKGAPRDVPVLSLVEDKGLFQESASQWRKGVAALLQPLRTAMDDKNSRRAREQSETLKKLAIGLGAERLKLKTVRLGVAVRAEEWLKAEKLFKELETECVAVSEAVRELV
ncbi:MAG: response regulator [Magnetococcales bacterium]|nr:response regulator [Magnetococcales bacterium]